MWVETARRVEFVGVGVGRKQSERSGEVLEDTDIGLRRRGRGFIFVIAWKVFRVAHQRIAI